MEGIDLEGLSGRLGLGVDFDLKTLEAHLVYRRFGP